MTKLETQIAVYRRKSKAICEVAEEISWKIKQHLTRAKEAEIAMAEAEDTLKNHYKDVAMTERECASLWEDIAGGVSKYLNS